MQLLDDPHSSTAAAVLAWVLSAIIVMSVGTFIAESDASLKEASGPSFAIIEVVCIVIFTIEYLTRIVCTPQPKRFMYSFFHLVDFLSIAPYYVELLFGGDGGAGSTSLLRALRLIRLLRLMKIGRYVIWMRIFGSTLQLSLHPLGMLGFITVLAVVFWSTFGYYIERGTWDETLDKWINVDGDPSTFTSIPASFWWAIVSLTTGACHVHTSHHASVFVCLNKR
jgi:potassium voltage-gated channel Shal-related subfamily D protein 2